MAKDFLSDSIKFVSSHWIDISLAIVGIFIITVYIIINNIDMRPPDHFGKSKVFIIEPLANKKIDAINTNDIFRNGFCNSHKGAQSLDESCRKLTKKSCGAVRCCVYAHEKEANKWGCVAGENGGPVFKSDKKGVPYTYDTWYYLGKKYPLKN